MACMNINGSIYKIKGIYDISVTVPDSFVVNDNKTCDGHGEAKLYMGSKEHMRNFYAGDPNNSGFEVQCIVLKKDLIHYMNTILREYRYPSIHYRGQGDKNSMYKLWKHRFGEIQKLTDVIEFKVREQAQIKGARGYVKVVGNPLKGGYGVIRTISLPFVSYISVMKLEDNHTGKSIFYWKLFTDFSQMAEQQNWAKQYGKKKYVNKEKKRDGQIKYRQDLFSQFGHCPFSKIDDVKLLIASHIKPWAVCDKKEKNDPNNGFMLSPLYDKLFDRGYISFEDNGQLKISDWLSEDNKARIDFDFQIDDLHLTEGRKKYLDYHRKNVFK